MKRKIIQIDQDKCIGCGLCANTCQQSAIQIINGKAKLMHENHCDGLGRCLSKCPADAISFSDKDITNDGSSQHKVEVEEPTGVCLGTQVKIIVPQSQDGSQDNQPAPVSSQLRQWPVQIKLVPTNAPYLRDAKLLIAADCTAFAHADFHNKFLKNHVVLIGCPKLDDGDYSLKLTEIIQNNDIQSITVVRMEVPCCAGIVNATTQALQNSGKMIPWQIVTISINGHILED